MPIAIIGDILILPKLPPPYTPKIPAQALFVLASQFRALYHTRMDRKQFIVSLGGNKAVADALSVDRSAVGNWLNEGRDIPWRHRPALARLATRMAVPLPEWFWG